MKRPRLPTLAPEPDHGRDRLREFLPASTESEASVAPQRRLVAVIGIDDYQQQPRLRCAVSDAVGMQRLLVEHFGFEAPIAPLTNGAATKPAIEALVEDQLRKVVGPDDALVLFFAGHGTTRTADVSGTRVEIGYLAPVEARGFDHYSSLVNMEELLRRIGLLPARHILVILDACHSGMALGSAVTQYRSPSAFSTKLLTNRSRRLITSARRDEWAHDSGPIPGHSLFTGTLLQALLSGEADLDGNGMVSFSELALCVQQRVAQASESRQTPDYGAFYLDDRGELVLFTCDPSGRDASQEPRGTSDGRKNSRVPPEKPGRHNEGGRARGALLGAGVVAAAGVAVALGLAVASPVWNIPPGWLLYNRETAAVGPARKYVVQKDDFPLGIAKRLGAAPARTQWWSELRGANPRKPVKNGNWTSLKAGEELGVPDEWPENKLAVDVEAPQALSVR